MPSTFRDLRCKGVTRTGRRCGALLGRINVTATGECEIEIKCTRGNCKMLNLFRVGQLVRS